MSYEDDRQYTEAESATNNGESMLSYEEEEEEYQKVRKEHVFSEIDFNKRKTKIVCTLG